MNYQRVNKKSNCGKTAIIVVITIIMVVALATSAFVVYTSFFSNRAKYLFDDKHNLDVEGIEELSGVCFKAEDLSYTGFEEELPDNGKYFDGSLDLAIINLHDNASETQFEEPNIGDVYNIQIEANGREYALEKMEIVDYHGEGTVEGYACFDEYLETEVVVYLLPYFYNEKVSPYLEVLWKPDMIEAIDKRPAGSVVDGYCFVITSFKPLEDIHFVSIEKVE